MARERWHDADTKPRRCDLHLRGFARNRRDNGGTIAAMSRLSRREGNLGDAGNSLARRTARIISFDPALSVPREAAHRRADERDDEGFYRRRPAHLFRRTRQTAVPCAAAGRGTGAVRAGPRRRAKTSLRLLP